MKKAWEIIWRLVLIIFAVVIIAEAAGCGSTLADVASHNLSKEAEQFRIERRIVFYNGITDKIRTIDQTNYRQKIFFEEELIKCL